MTEGFSFHSIISYPFIHKRSFISSSTVLKQSTQQITEQDGEVASFGMSARLQGSELCQEANVAEQRQSRTVSIHDK